MCLNMKGYKSMPTPRRTPPHEPHGSAVVDEQQQPVLKCVFLKRWQSTEALARDRMTPATFSA